ncbi:hypothetical protein PACTADRAFT_51970 [Pachysolen tannophilus NRRL Y-2460]|uniref:Increased recombination centers protein 22 n=1 Tax=Pachysolen tannophilus NRRL Y-2460 TaxID=669874 RepID=A0A1E4TNR0_PACTA|nr:hypothetical protein PACTADRAFT_51970 [Pachysolen tannophilus NRRL Y-2460]
MKLFSILAASISLFSILPKGVNADSNLENFVPTEKKPFKFEIHYSVLEKQKSITDIVPVENGETFILGYTFINGEDNDVTIVGVGGSFNDPTTGFVHANISDASLGPLLIPAGTSANFSQKVGVDVAPSDYLVVPTIYASYNHTLIALGTRSQLISVEDPKVSIFNPQLIFLEIILVASIAGLGYILYVNFGYKYLKGAAPIRGSASLSATSKVSTVGKTSGYDESWLPKEHLKSKRTRKAN